MTDTPLRKLKGIAVSSGIIIGKAHLIDRSRVKILTPRDIHWLSTIAPSRRDWPGDHFVVDGRKGGRLDRSIVPAQFLVETAGLDDHRSDIAVARVPEAQRLIVRGAQDATAVGRTTQVAHRGRVAAVVP